MSERILTLFGEEIVPEQLKAAGKSRAKKKPAEQKEEDQPATKEENEQLATEQPASPVAEAIAAEQAPVPATAKEVLPQQEDAPAPTKTKKAKPNPEDTFVLPEDWEGTKQYYTIGEVADLFKVKTSHIRFWTNEFKLKVRTTRKGDRMYTPAQVRELRAIHHLVKERGFTLSGAKAKLKTQNNRDVETVDLKQSLLQLRNKLVILRNQLA